MSHKNIYIYLAVMLGHFYGLFCHETQGEGLVKGKEN